jgi:short-subunit dehydrogenase
MQSTGILPAEIPISFFCCSPVRAIAVLKNRLIWSASAVAAAAIANAVRDRGSFQFRGRCVLITGGSRGLGFLLAQEFARRGARVAIVARDREELWRAARQLRRITRNVLPIAADLMSRKDIEAAVAKVERKFGAVDVLVNNAGIISVGPLDTSTPADYQNSLNTHFWAPYHATMAVLPEMRRRKQGRIVNISSIGGKISVPHLLPYSVGKFALTAFSEGLRAQLLQHKIYVTTVCPGLMRTGSPRNATFKGKHRKEYAWFSISDSLPLISMSADRAALQIVNACARGEAELVLSTPAKLAVLLNGLFPGATANLMALFNYMLPGPGGIGRNARKGKESFSFLSPSMVTVLTERAALRNNQAA